MNLQLPMVSRAELLLVGCANCLTVEPQVLLEEKGKTPMFGSSSLLGQERRRWAILAIGWAAFGGLRKQHNDRN